MQTLFRVSYVERWNDLFDIAVLAHVCQYMEFCDDILLLEDGEIQEAGNHQTLMTANRRYAQLITNYQMEQSKVRLKCTLCTTLTMCFLILLLVL